MFNDALSVLSYIYAISADKINQQLILSIGEEPFSINQDELRLVNDRLLVLNNLHENEAAVDQVLLQLTHRKSYGFTLTKESSKVRGHYVIRVSFALETTLPQATIVSKETKQCTQLLDALERHIHAVVKAAGYAPVADAPLTIVDSFGFHANTFTRADSHPTEKKTHKKRGTQTIERVIEPSAKRLRPNLTIEHPLHITQLITALPPFIQNCYERLPKRNKETLQAYLVKKMRGHSKTTHQVAFAKETHQHEMRLISNEVLLYIFGHDASPVHGTNTVSRNTFKKEWANFFSQPSINRDSTKTAKSTKKRKPVRKVTFSRK
jgi:hypothetical protein